MKRLHTILTALALATAANAQIGAMIPRHSLSAKANTIHSALAEEDSSLKTDGPGTAVQNVLEAVLPQTL